MKKLTTLLLAAGLVVSSFSGAKAGEFIPNAQFINQYTWGTGGEGMLEGGDDKEHFEALLRLRLGFDYIASESLSGTFLFQVGAYEYKILDAHYNDNNSFRVRLAYVDWVVPTTDVKVRMGLQPFAMPAFAVGSNIINGRGTGVTVVAPITNDFNLVAGWMRAVDSSENNDYNAGLDNEGDEADIFALIADYKNDNFHFAPYAAFVTMGQNTNVISDGNVKFPTVLDLTSGELGFGNIPVNSTGAVIPGWDHLGYEGATAWLVGASFKLTMFDPFTFALDAYYSSGDANYDAANIDDQDMNGFLVAASASYKTQYGVPAIKGWYASGNDEADFERNSAGDITGLRDGGLGQPIALAGAFAPTTIMFEDQVMEGRWANQTEGNAGGTWGVLVEWAGFSFIDKLTHTARVAYIEGTNEQGSLAIKAAGENYLAYLYDDEDVVEVNLNSTYEIYKNFTATLQLGWLTADLSEDSRGEIRDDMDDDIFRSALSFVYKF